MAAPTCSPRASCYELLTGHKPFEAETQTAVIVKILHNPPTPMDTYVTGLLPALYAAVERALEKSPANRFATADLLGRSCRTCAVARRAGRISQPGRDGLCRHDAAEAAERRAAALIDGQREAAPSAPWPSWRRLHSAGICSAGRGISARADQCTQPSPGRRPG